MALQMDRYLKDLEHIINIDSSSSDVEGNLRMAEFFAGAFEEAGFATEVHRVGQLNRPVVVAKTPARKSLRFIWADTWTPSFPGEPPPSGLFTFGKDVRSVRARWI